MHFELPKAKSLREFGGEYLMIVISIMTALALEHAVQAWYHRHVAELAAVKIDHELRANARSVADVQEHNKAEVRKLMAIARELRTGILNQVDDAVLTQRILGEWRDSISSMSALVPMFRREAWEAAVASHAASWMPDEALERYSSAYANMHDVQAIQFSSGAAIDMSRYMDTISNLEMGQSDPREVYRTLNQMVRAYNANENLDGLRQALQKAGGAVASNKH